jgi:hypothetical protein
MLAAMALSPTSAGFRATYRYPSVTLAEIAWRWAVGATAAALSFFGLIEYIDMLPVTGGDRMLLRTRHPYLVGRAIAHIFQGKLSRVVLAFVAGSLLLTLLWIVASSVGRIATVRALLDYFRGQVGQASGGAAGGERDVVASNVSTGRFVLSALLRLNFLRAAAGLAAVFAIFGAAILAGFASPAADPAPGLAFFLFLFLAGLVWAAWTVLNWMLSLAGLFAVRDGVRAIDAISAAATFSRERAGAVFAVSAWTGLAHVILYMGVTTAVLLPLGFVGVVPWRLIVLAAFLITLAYFAAVDWLYTARLAGYLCIAEMPQPTLLPAPLPPISPVPLISLQTTIDRDELILGDVPNPQTAGTAPVSEQNS